MLPFLFCFVVIYMSLKDDIEYNLINYLDSIINKSFMGRR